MENKFEPLRTSKTLVVEKKVLETEVSFSEPALKKETAKKVLFENNEPQKRVELEINKKTPTITNFEFEATKSFINETSTDSIIEKEEQVKDEREISKKTEESIDKDTTSVFTNEFFEFANKDKVPQQKNIKKAKPGLKARFKIIVFGFIAVLACFFGWSIYNAIEIETLRAQIQESNKIYAVNIVNYIKTISKSDDLTSSDSFLNLQQLSDANIIPIAPEIEPFVEYNVTSNWFDRVCNWISNIFK